MGDFLRTVTVTRTAAGSAPKYLIGESYGTTRASGLVGYLQSQHEIYMNGVVLVSMTNLGYERGGDLSFATVLPYMIGHGVVRQEAAGGPAEAAAEGRAGPVGALRDERIPARAVKGGLVTPERGTRWRGRSPA